MFEFIIYILLKHEFIVKKLRHGAPVQTQFQLPPTDHNVNIWMCCNSLQVYLAVLQIFHTPKINLSLRTTLNVPFSSVNPLEGSLSIIFS